MRKILSNQLRFVSFTLVALLVSAGLVLGGAEMAAAFSGCSAENAPVVNAEFEKQVAQLVNEVRADNGLPPLKLVASLSAAARYHATDLGRDDYFQHDSHDRSGDSLQRVCGTFDRIRLWYNDWSAAAENIAAGYNTPEAVLAGWMDSDGHRGNILNPNFTEFGVGYFTGAGKFPSYWVQDFGTRSDVTPMILAGESAVTTNRQLGVYVHGKWGEMRLRNDNGGWSDWMPFANSFTWTINDGSGQHVVSAELRSGGTTRSTCDTITLASATAADAQAPLEPDKVTSKVYLPAIQNGPPINCEQ
jgi:uncharacterized protein YkwD